MLGALALPGATALPSQQRVGVGLERVEAEEGEPLRGQRVGLIAHAASVTWDGRHALAVLRGVGVDVRRVFAPEHGWHSEAAAGAHIDSGVEAGVPLVSLYGENRRPAASDLMDLDTIVFDLQDGGVRFYTYISTMISSLQAAAESGLRFVVLDRPNPLGGMLVEGPTRAEDEPPGFLSLAPGPLVHGLTAGELARLAVRELQLDLRLEVVLLEGWRREMTWPDTRRPWPRPSPNLRTGSFSRSRSDFATSGLSTGRITRSAETEAGPAPRTSRTDWIPGPPWQRVAARKASSNRRTAARLKDPSVVAGRRWLSEARTACQDRRTRRPSRSVSGSGACRGGGTSRSPVRRASRARSTASSTTSGALPATRSVTASRGEMNPRLPRFAAASLSSARLSRRSSRAGPSSAGMMRSSEISARARRKIAARRSCRRSAVCSEAGSEPRRRPRATRRATI